MIKAGSKWYWYVCFGKASIRKRAESHRVGEDKTNGTAFVNINCYSSSNLVEWTYEGALLSQTASGDTGPGRVIERPKVIFNKNTNKYVMWMHIDSANYGEAKIGVATGDSVCGKYNYLRSERPLGFESRDSGLYVDDDGKAYLLTEDVSQADRIHFDDMLKKVAPKWPPHQRTFGRLLNSNKERIYMEGEIRGPCSDQEKRRLLHVFIATLRLEPK